MARRRYAAMAGAIAGVLLLVGFILTRWSGAVHDFGLISFGYGIGVAAAAVSLALGYEPKRRRK